MDTALATESRTGLPFTRRFTPEGTDPLETVTWVIRDAVIVGSEGQELFRHNGVEVPEGWSDTTTNIVAEKYFRLVNGVRETSAKQMFARVADWIHDQAIEQNLFDSQQSTENFRADLLYMLVQGWFAFNSPVWFNAGVKEKPQCSACFIQPIADTMDGIMKLQASETRLFKQGSGTGTNFSSLRSSYETLSTGGYASGPVSFMRGFDSNAGATKSGGSTRRAAKIVILNVSHPDVLEQKNGESGFIRCKAEDEVAAHDLYSTGRYSAEWNKPGNVYERVGRFQNANNSVRVPDEFMKAVDDNKDWQTKKVKTGEVVHTYKARDLYNEIAKAAHICGCPGLQFDDTINSWHTCPSSGRINATNPCAEFAFVDDSACNLGSLNLLSFVVSEGFHVENFEHACSTAITAMEVLVDSSSYPTESIGINSHKFRPLGLGYTNLGALLTYWGLPYDSNKGRNTAASITAIMSGVAYSQSARLASVLGPFEEYAKNQNHMIKIVERHAEAARTLPAITNTNRKSLISIAYASWKQALELGTAYGYRNAQVTLLAPTGTISFLLGCDTTGIEPMLGCITYKKLVGEGLVKLPNSVVKPALANLNYTTEQIEDILNHLQQTGDIHSAEQFDERRDGAIFAEALGKHALAPEAHVDMMASVQPFLSGSISKTVNMPQDCSIDDVAKIYRRAWTSGLKCIAIFRDKCKLSQPISTTKTEMGVQKRLHWGERRRMPIDADSKRHKFEIGGQEGYVHAGIYPDGSLGEIFLDISKQGSTLNGLLEAFATSVSIGLQHGVPKELYCEKFKDTRFDPSGFGPTFPDPERRTRHFWSVLDYIFRWIEWRFNNLDVKDSLAPTTQPAAQNWDGPPCQACGMLTKRSGTCYVCSSCGETTGCG